MEKKNLIPCLAWVPRGRAKSKVEKIRHNREELRGIIAEMKMKSVEYESRPNHQRRLSQAENSNSEAEDNAVDDYYEMDDYDNEDAEPMSGAGIENLIVENPPETDSEDSDAEPDEFTVKPDDNLILSCHIDDDVVMLEVYVFNHENADLFLLHDIFLSSYPMAVKWIDFNPKDADTPGHYAAVGYISNEIDVWDLNVSGSLEPILQLGGKKTKKADRHSEAVLDLAWSPLTRNVLASGSVDHTVRLWDMTTEKCLSKLSVFGEKVQSIEFHGLEPGSLVAGSCDGRVRVFDCRSTSTYKTWVFENEIERVLWNPYEPFNFFASTDAGMVHYVDVRNNEPVWSVHAVEPGAEEGVTGLCMSSGYVDMLVTGSTDGTLKIWDIKESTPSIVVRKTNMNIGPVNALSSCPDVPYVFCAGGIHKDNQMYLWDSRDCDRVVELFQDRSCERFVYDEEHGMFNRIAENSGQVQQRKKKKNKALKAIRTDSTPTSQAGPSTASASTATATAAKKKKNRKKMHPKTPKD